MYMVRNVGWVTWAPCFSVCKWQGQYLPGGWWLRLQWDKTRWLIDATYSFPPVQSILPMVVMGGQSGHGMAGTELLNDLGKPTPSWMASSWARAWGPASVLVSWGTLGPGGAIRRPPTPHITPAASSGSTFGDSSSLVWTVEERRKFRIHTLIVVKASNHWLNVILARKFDPIYVPILQLRKLRLRHENQLTELGFESRKPNP